MIIEIGDKLVSQDILKEEFVCNLGACKGACCVEGDDGAPLTHEEVDLLEEYIEEIKPFLSEKGLAQIEAKGVFYMDRENEPVTALIQGGECAFVYRDEKGITKCAVETAYKADKIPFNKPISCHLYPIRARKFEKFEALNYDRWPICKDACTLGKELKVPVYKFLKEPIIRKYGEGFYKELEEIDKNIKQDREK